MHLSTVDWVVVGVVGLSALSGLRRGLIASALSLAGLAAGAYVGSRTGPHLLRGGSVSAWTPIAALAGALVGALVLQAVAGIVGSFFRGGLRLTPFRFLDSAGGLVLGAVTGIAFAWVVSAAALLVPHQQVLRQQVQSSTILRRLDQAVPPRTLLNLLARVDPLPSILGPAAPSTIPGAAISADPAIRRASASVVRVLGTACGIGVEGSGWFARPDLVVTAAHVVAGESDTTVEIPGEAQARRAVAVAFDTRNDVAVLRVAGANAAPLPLVDPTEGTPVAIVGYPQNGPLVADPGTIGPTGEVLTQDALGNGPVSRTITAVAGTIEHGDSGGPAIDRSGAVQSTIFAARVGSKSGYGVPAALVRRALGAAAGPVSTGPCPG